MKKILLLSILLPVFAYAQVITTYAGAAGHYFAGDYGPATDASFDYPYNVAVDNHGNILVADFWNARIRCIDRLTGIITTIAGNGSFKNSGDGGPATDAGINFPTGVVTDRMGNMYITCDSITDASTHYYVMQGSYVRKVSASGIITTIAGTGSAVYSGDGGPATDAGIGQTNGINVDTAGNIFIAEMASCIRKVNPAGIITTIAGNGTGGYAGDNGPATDALIWRAGDVVPDNKGNLYFTDASHIRMIDTMGIMHTIAGDSSSGYTGDGGPATAARLGCSFGLALDDSGNIFFSDILYPVVRKISTSGIITTIAGNGIMGNMGDGGDPDSAEISSVYGVAIDSLNNIYLSDVQNENIRMICTSCSCNSATKIITLNHADFTIRPCHAYGTFTVLLTSISQDPAKLIVTNMNGEKAMETICIPGIEMQLNLNVPPGVYLVTAITAEQRISVKIEVR